jgi:hypothetical protein
MFRGITYKPLKGARSRTSHHPGNGLHRAEGGRTLPPSCQATGLPTIQPHLDEVPLKRGDLFCLSEQLPPQVLRNLRRAGSHSDRRYALTRVGREMPALLWQAANWRGTPPRRHPVPGGLPPQHGCSWDATVAKCRNKTLVT